jgi:Mg-chelatase subunit ChlD
MGNKANYPKKIKGKAQYNNRRNTQNDFSSKNLGRSFNSYNETFNSSNNSQNSNNYNLNSDLITNLNKTYTFHGQKSSNFIVHKNDSMNDFIIELNLTKFDKSRINKRAEFIMILDISGSMGGHVHKLISDIIPKGLNMLNYDDYDKIYLITFESDVDSSEKTIKELKNDSTLEGRGGTYMAGVYQKLKSILMKNGNQQNYRILVLSDGEIADQTETVIQAEELKKFVDDNKYSLSIGSIRYNTGYGQPDTRAISSVLMLNTDNTKEKVLTEVSSNDPNEKISRKIYELFKDDYFESGFTIQSDKIKFRIEPWKEGTNSLKLKEGNNIIFADGNPSLEKVGIFEGGRLKYKKDDFKNGYKINYSNYNTLLGAKINMTARKVRINKTSGSKAALEENKKIINYFENFEKKLIGNENKETIISKELKMTNDLDISNYDNNQLAQFIGVDKNIIPITDFLKNALKLDEKEETSIEEFTKSVFQNTMKIDLAFDKLFKS